MKFWILGILVPSAAALFFPTSGGGGGCCCGCGTPQPASCGCGPVCPPPQPCPACAAPPPCPPPPTAICPQVQPVYIPSPCQGSSCGGYGGGYGGGCSGGGCGGGGGGCGGGSCGGGGGCSGGGCGGGGGGGYASNGGGGGGGGYVAGGGGGYAQQAPSSGYVASSGPTYTAPAAVAPAAEPTYSQGGGGGASYQQNVEAAALQADDPNGSAPTATSAAQAPAPSLTQAFRAPQICEPQKVKYVVLRAKKLNGNLDEVEEEVEEVERPTSLEATASPLDQKELTEEILREEDAEGAAQARGATTLTDAKCNSKPLRDLVLENIAKDDSLTSKRQIHEASMRKFPEHTVDVICSTTGFTYLVSTTEHCEAQRDNVICFVYKRPI